MIQGMEEITLELDDELAAWLEQAASTSDVPVSEIVCELLTAARQTGKPPPPEPR
jgi:hypothetical protein